MASWLSIVESGLTASPQPVPIFFRDDDAGWADTKLFNFLDVFAQWQMPIDLAVIPAALNQGLAEELLARRRRNTALLGLHQHGYSHTNHEPADRRKCEFGPTRSKTQQQADIESGISHLNGLLGDANDPIFTPPWNRCTEDTIDCLENVGFEILSQDLGAAPIKSDTLKAAPVDINWSRLIRENDHPHNAFVVALADSIARNNITGIMFHHADMDTQHLADLSDLLRLLSSHPNAKTALIKNHV